MNQRPSPYFGLFAGLTSQFIDAVSYDKELAVDMLTKIEFRRKTFFWERDMELMELKTTSKTQNLNLEVV